MTPRTATPKPNAPTPPADTTPDEPELEPLPDTEAYNTFRAVTELIHGLGFDPNRVQTITLDNNGVRVFSRNAEGRNVAKMIRFEEVTGTHRRRIVAEVVGE